MENDLPSVSTAQLTEISTLFDALNSMETNPMVGQVLDLGYPKDGKLEMKEMRFYKVEQPSFDEEYPHREAFENVLLSLENQAFNFVYILNGSELGIDLYFGIVRNRNENQEVGGERLSAANCGDNLARIFTGNFSGSKLKKLSNKELQALVIDPVEQYRSAGMILGIPSVQKRDGEEEHGFQGIDRLINSMTGLNWRMAVICEPVSKSDIQLIRKEVYDLYNRLALFAKQTVQAGKNQGETISFGHTVSHSTGRNVGYNKGENSGTSKSSEKRSSHSSSSSGSNYSIW